MTNKFYLGIDIGGSKCVVVAGTETMEILEQVRIPTETEQGPEYMINILLDHASKIFDKLKTHTLVSIGISCGGPLNSETGLIMSPPNLPGWDNIQITQFFTKRFGVPVFLHNDANACALAEWRFGAGMGTQNMIFLTFGTGLGAGMILNGKLYTGTNNMAGEIGHIRLAEDGPSGYGKQGSFEGFCSGGGIARLAQLVISQKMSNGEDVGFLNNVKDIKKITTEQLSNAANAGDKTALEIFKISGKYLGVGISILIDILNPERIVIGSVFARNPHLFEAICKEVIEKEALKPASEVCEIVPAALGDQLGDYASLCVAIPENINQDFNLPIVNQNVSKKN